MRSAQVNGHPALILRLDGAIDTVLAVRIDDGLITGLHAVRSPEKLSRVERETVVSRRYGRADAGMAGDRPTGRRDR
ncbi:hypothetical protein GCM10017752_01380 [Streptomyces roseoviridis]